MRLTTIGAALVVAGCAGTQTADTTQAAKRACGGISCFYEREVRDFEVVDHTTLIVYVGAQRCPYQVEPHRHLLRHAVRDRGVLQLPDRPS